MSTPSSKTGVNTSGVEASGSIDVKLAGATTLFAVTDGIGGLSTVTFYDSEQSEMVRLDFGSELPDGDTYINFPTSRITSYRGTDGVQHFNPVSGQLKVNVSNIPEPARKYIIQFNELMFRTSDQMDIELNGEVEAKFT